MHGIENTSFLPQTLFPHSWTKLLVGYSFTPCVRSRLLIGFSIASSDGEVDLEIPQDLVLAAEELRYAAQSIGKITGRIDVEDILDTIFREFCIGK